MAQQFEDQGGLATSNPPAIVRWLTSKLMSWMISPAAQNRRRARAERARVRSGEPHRIEYFHQVEDAYSHLAAQLLRPLLETYDVELVPHLVTVEKDRNLPEPELLPPLARHEAGKLAPYYGLRFPGEASSPSPDLVDRARAILTRVAPSDFPEAAVAVGDALWHANASELEALARKWGSFTDAAREARALGRDFGPFYDPIGEPVRRAYSLWPWARECSRGDELLQSFLRRAFYEGVNTGSDDGLRRVVEGAGLPWDEAQRLVGTTDWEDEVEANRLAMLDMGCWGVPSFRLLDRDGSEVLAVWGQDRLWLVSHEIQRLLAAS